MLADVLIRYNDSDAGCLEADVLEEPLLNISGITKPELEELNL